MKIIITFAMCCVAGACLAQTNTFPSSGNVGIGTTSPNSTLSIKGRLGVRADATPTLPTEALRVEGAISSEESVANFTNLSDQDFLILLSGAGAGNKRAIIGPSVSTRLSLGVNVKSGNEYLSVIAGGNVGVGITNPSQRLDVNGIAKFRQRLQVSGNAYPTTGMGVEIGYNDPEGVITSYDRSTSIYKSLRYNAANHIFQVSGAEVAVFSSNGIGIGTSSPGYPLDVSGITRIRQRVQVTGNTYPTNGVGVEIGYTGTTGIITSYDRNVSEVRSMRYNAGDHKFEINNVEKLVVTGAGNVGIGKSNPAYPLDVSGSVNATSFLINGVPVGPGTTPWTSSGANISYTNGNIGVGEAAQPNTRFSLRASGTTTNTAFRIVDNTSTEKFKILDNGTTTVTGPVTVSSGVLTLANVGSVATFQQMSPYSNNTESIITIPTGATDQGVVFKGLNQINGAVYDAVTIGALNYSFSSGSGGKFRALSISPTLNLTGTYSGTVVGLEYNPSTTALFGTTHIAADFKKGQLRLGEIANDDALTQVIVREPSTGELKYRSVSSIGGSSLWTSSGANAFYDAGNIGIGVSNPQNKLDVNGTIHTREVKVDLNNWPDYVFNNDYELAPLSELKKYITQNKHLPGVPTTKEVEENGVMLGEMNKVLLMKLEEVTLHLIKLNEENEDLKSRLKEIEKRIN